MRTNIVENIVEFQSSESFRDLYPNQCESSEAVRKKFSISFVENRSKINSTHPDSIGDFNLNEAV